MVNATFFFIILISHLLAFLPTWQRIRNSEHLTVVDWSILSVLLYYDTGLGLEAFNLSSTDKYFINFFSASEDTLIQAFTVLFFLPWMFRFPTFMGEKLGYKIPPLKKIDDQKIKKSRRLLFFLATTLLILIPSYIGLTMLQKGGDIWNTRIALSQDLGGLAILLYMPIHLLAFYITKKDSKTTFGVFFCLFLCLASIVSTLAIGQRTTVIIPIIIVLLFRNRLNAFKLISLLLIGIFAASTLLPIFKGQYSNANYSTRELALQTVQFDISRSNALISALERSESLGTRLLPYPMSGYVYSFLFYIPRQIAPFKGQSTAQHFTGDIVGTSVERTNWGFGIGLLEETLLNAGFLFCLPLLLLYGFCFYQMDRLSNQFSSLIVPSRLAALWICGYNLPAIILLFGTMAFICWLLHCIFI
jgi:hypothetical protein